MAESRKKTYNLQYHEIVLLKKLSEVKASTVVALDKLIAIDQAAVVRAAMNLSKLGLLKMDEKDKFVVALTQEGTDVLDNGLPEKQFIILALKQPVLSKIAMKDKNVALGWAKKGCLVELMKKDADVIVKVTDEGMKFSSFESDIEKSLDSLADGKPVAKDMIGLLKKRRFITVDFRTVRNLLVTPAGEKIAKSVKIVKEVSRLTPGLLKDGRWKDVSFRKYNVVAPVSKVYNGRKHPLRLVMEHINEAFIEMGFKEMAGPLVETAFWCMDSMFIPQDHPAREVQDTFYLPLTGNLPDRKIVEKVKRVHEGGGDTGSRGYGFSWNDDAAKKVLLRTHTTSTTFRYFGLKNIKPPAKYFCIGRVFRNETLDMTHGAEFFQVEGFVMAEDITLSSLKSYIKEFYSKFGINKIRFKPTYNPYTEPSMEAFAYHE
ncbi:MAG: phenylalanine--tRNA ligase subunit alpha, partial [archaeon]|nr:phenylalanine--tRNA ligase subunit alpha [archaeon]